MFNSYSYNGGNSIKINAVSGGILKNHPKSWFERFHLKSDRASELLTEGGYVATKQDFIDGHFGQYPNPDKDIIVLQMAICGNMEVIAECVYRKDYENINGELKDE